MTDRNDDELDPVERLRAADPAAGLEPRAGFTDDVVARVTTEAADAPAVASAAVTDLAAERARRRNRWLTVAAVAASMLVVGGAGYAVGATNTGSTTVAGGAAPPISLESGVGTAPTEMGVPETDASAVAPQSRATPGFGSDRILPYAWGRNVFHASGLSTEDGTAPAYAYDARSASNAENVGALAAALGLTGTPELKDGGWAVGPQDGTAASLWVTLDGTLGFSYWDPQHDPWRCAPDATACEPTGTAPTEVAAIDAMRSLVSASGRDADAFEYTSEVYEGSLTRTVQAWPLIDGQRTDQGWYLELAEGGVLNASGSLAATVSLGDYPIVSEQEAFERLSDPRFGPQVTAMPFSAQQAPMEFGTAGEPPAAPTGGTALSWPVNEVEIVEARLGLATHWQVTGGVLLVPAYEFTDAAGGTWSVIALADSMLDFGTQ
ncbi:hypothetical protein [Agromyces sp. Marseille-P2726]|uniref:hypothetical protein n=1 Tax=Agromyces sp. Marseille-P2726 TaxID=2709132 RepID=UPI00156FAB10|nr:hypothetical protein [Agromyces sp. Marseille-P2726]